MKRAAEKSWLRFCCKYHPEYDRVVFLPNLSKNAELDIVLFFWQKDGYAVYKGRRGSILTDKAAEYIVDRLCRTGHIDNREKAVYKVGFDVIMGTFVNGAVILTAGILLKDAAGAFLFLICFCTTRNYCGGYHAKTRLKCLLTMLSAFCCVSVMSGVLLQVPGVWRLGYGAVSAALGGLLFAFVPVADITKRYNVDDVTRNRKKALRILVMWYAATGIGIFWNRMAAAEISMTMNAVAVMILVTRPWKRMDGKIIKTNEKERKS